ncbi:MAG: nucleoside phosphorylase [FCB group bacterium]|nr:nucleoside phosphorylase [FCB group bacterium]
MKKNVQPLTRLAEGDVAPYVFLCGDPGRVPRIAAAWTNVREVCRTREYLAMSGEYDGVPLTVISTGIGAPSTAIVVEEAANLGARVFMRVGNSGTLAQKVDIGDYVITTAAVRDDGTSKGYVIPEYPAAAHYEVVSALVKAAKTTAARWHVGVTWSFDGFYSRNKVVTPEGGVGTMSHGGYSQSGMNNLLADMQQAGVLNCEMEAGTILTLASLFGLKAGAICTVSDRTPWPGPSADSLDLDKNMDGCIEIALAAMLDLARNGG